MSASPAPTTALEHQLFWLLVKKGHRREDVARVYLAVQAALAYGQSTLDTGWLIGAMMPDGRRTTNSVCDRIGADGLAYFYWLFEVELLSIGEEDSHQYRFRRRADGAQIVVQLRTARAPRSLQFQQEYERQRRTLEEKHAQLRRETRW